METTIRPLTAHDMAAASKLAQRVFDRFEGPDYSAEGIETFHRFTAPDAMAVRIGDGRMEAWGAFRGARLAGLLAARDTNHISLLFVEEEHHRQGIGRALFDRFAVVCRERGIRRITVNSSPFAVAVYLRLGFESTSPEQLQEGIRFTPMEYWGS